MWGYADSRDAIADALRLSRAMTFKAAVADLPLGGGKGVIMREAGGPPLDAERRRAALLDFGDTVDVLGGRYMTAEDVGTSDADMPVIAERTPHVTGLAVESGSSGDPSPWTALGVREAVSVACERVWGSGELAERTVAVVGLGRVGGALARGLAATGARLVVADVDPSKRALADELGAEWTDPDTALRADVDVVAPCALGGVLDAESVAELRCRAIAGAANNQLASESVAELLVEREILWAPDFVVNAGGIINISVELEPEGYAPERAEARVRAVGDTLRTIFDDAADARTTPLAAAMALAYRRLAEASAPPPAASLGAPPA
jgi:leucine dehydrogenase